MRVHRTLESVPPLAAPSEQKGAGPQLVTGHPPTGGFARVVRGLGQELDRGEALAERAIHGGGPGASMSPEALIALQAGIYRYSEAVDLVTKVVDRATQAVKTTLQNQ